MLKSSPFAICLLSLVSSGCDPASREFSRNDGGPPSGPSPGPSPADTGTLGAEELPDAAVSDGVGGAPPQPGASSGETDLGGSGPGGPAQDTGGAGTGGATNGAGSAGEGGAPSNQGGEGPTEPPCNGCVIDGVCVGASEANPSNPCELCEPTANPMDWSTDEGAPCDDDAFCTVDDVCSMGVCAGNARECDDDVSCNGEGRCDESLGQCVAGETQCGEDFCDLGLDECVTSCDGCLVAGQCVPEGQEQAGNPCLVCDPSVSSETYSPAPGKVCGQGPTTCSEQDTCSAEGICEPNHSPMDTACGASSSSTCNGADTCDGAGMCQTNVADNGTTCDDGQYCTTNSECQGGTCVSTQSRMCAANELCDEQMDSCECTGCVVGGTCVASGATNPSNSCQVCAPMTSTSAYSAVTDGTGCTGGECQMGFCEPFPNPFDCVAPDPPEVILPDDIVGLTGNPPSNTGGTIQNGIYMPVSIDGYDGATNVDLMSFEFSNGFVQIGFRNFAFSNGFAPIGEVQFAGSFTTSGSSLTFDAERCDPQYDLDPPDVSYTISANGMRTEQVNYQGHRVVVSYLRQ